MTLLSRFHLIAIPAMAGAVAACSPSQRSADTASVLAIDTLKTGATVAAAPPDTIKPLVSATPPKTSTTKTTTTKTTTTTTKTVTARDTAHLGRDSVIRINPNDPRRQLPTVPPKKPQQ